MRLYPSEHENVSCRGKVTYRSGCEAGKAKTAMKRKRRHGPADDTLNVYRCRYCDGWHLGRPTKLTKRCRL